MDSLVAQAHPMNCEIAANRRQAAQTQSMIADFERLVADLDREVRAEEDRTKIRDPRHFAYSTVAKAAALRRDNLARSVALLRAQLEASNGALNAALNKPQTMGGQAKPSAGQSNHQGGHL